MVDAPVRAISFRARQAPRQGDLGRCARHRSRGLESPRPEHPLGGITRERAADDPAGHRRDARHHRLHRAHRGRPADDARQERQRLLRVDLRRSARCGRDRDLDGRGWRAQRGSAARAGCDGHRFALVQRGDGACLLRRQGHSSANDGAGGGEADSDLDQEHVRAGQNRIGHFGDAELDSSGEGDHEHRRRGAGQRRGRGHDRCTRHRAAIVRRAARGRHLGDSDIAGELRAFDLLCDPACGSGAHGAHRTPRVPRGAERRPDSERRRRARLQHPLRRRRRHGGNAGRRGAGIWIAGCGRRERPRDCARLLRAQHLRRHRRTADDEGAAVGARRLLSVAAHDLSRHHRSGRGRQRPARAAGVADRPAHARLPHRPAAARRDDDARDGAVGYGDSVRCLARCAQGRRPPFTV